MSADGIQDKLAMFLPECQGLLQQRQQVLGDSRIVAVPGHPLDQGALLGDALLALGEVLVRQDQMFALLIEVNHHDTHRRVVGRRLRAAASAYGFGAANEGTLCTRWNPMSKQMRHSQNAHSVPLQDRNTRMRSRTSRS